MLLPSSSGFGLIRPTETLELQLGTMITPTVGLYGELLLGDTVFDTDAYEIGTGLALRIVF